LKDCVHGVAALSSAEASYSRALGKQTGASAEERGVAAKRKTVVESSRPTKAPRSESDSEIKEGVRSTMDKLLSLVAEESIELVVLLDYAFAVIYAAHLTTN